MEINLPEKWDNLTGFQKLILVKIFKPDKVIAGVKKLVAQEIGPEFVLDPPQNFGAVFKEVNII